MPGLQQCPPPVQSQLDRRLYRTVYLANGIKVLLVQDDEADKCAAAMDVGVCSALRCIGRESNLHFFASFVDSRWVSSRTQTTCKDWPIS